MSISMYNNSIPVFVRYLNNLSGILAAGATYATEQGIDESVLINARLFPNMLPLSRQVQIACDMVKRAGARLSGDEPTSTEDMETTFAELSARIDATKAYLLTLSEEKINASSDIKIVMPAGPVELTFTGVEYLNLWALPNMFFHVTTAYNILRHNGVALGKIDYLGVADFRS